jgi:hypothetical protein
MLKGRLNNAMRDDMQNALLAHAFEKRAAVLRAEGLELRNEALRRILTPKQMAAIATLVPLIYSDEDRHPQAITWGDRVAINCAGPKIDVGLASFAEDYYERYRPIDGALPLLTSLGEQRLDVDSDDELGKRTMDWADRCEAYRTERRVASEQVKAALAAFSTVSQMQASWPDALPVVEEILEEHLGRPAPGLPAIVLTELNASLGLPPSDNDAEGVRELEAA